MPLPQVTARPFLWKLDGAQLGSSEVLPPTPRLTAGLCCCCWVTRWRMRNKGRGTQCLSVKLSLTAAWSTAPFDYGSGALKFSPPLLPKEIHLRMALTWFREESKNIFFSFLTALEARREEYLGLLCSSIFSDGVLVFTFLCLCDHIFYPALRAANKNGSLKKKIPNFSLKQSSSPCNPLAFPEWHKEKMWLGQTQNVAKSSVAHSGPGRADTTWGRGKPHKMLRYVASGTVVWLLRSLFV